LCPGRKLWLDSSKILRSSLDSIMVWINLTSQNSGSQCMWAVHTKMGWCTWLASGGSPDVRYKKILQNHCYLQNDCNITLYSTHIVLSEGSKSMKSPNLCIYKPSDPVNSFHILNEHLSTPCHLTLSTDSTVWGSHMWTLIITVFGNGTLQFSRQEPIYLRYLSN